MASAIVRLRLHVTGPDGRQAGPVTLGCAVAGAGVLVAGVVVVGTLTCVWYFDEPVDADGEPEPALTVAGIRPYYTGDAEHSYVVECAYSGHVIVVGDPWALTMTPVHVVGPRPFVVPQSGRVSG